MENRPDRYNKLSIGAHWLTFALLVAVYALMELRGIFPKDSPPRDLMKTWHYMLGLTVFCIVFARLALRLVFRAPPITPEPSVLMKRLAGAMHVVLYAFLFAMPLLGWLTLSVKAQAIPFFGLHLPPLTGPDKTLGADIKEIHETIGTIGYYLIGLHVAAALFHHYFIRDNTLSRMWPGRGRGARAG
jgi:cytochrome b561